MILSIRQLNVLKSIRQIERIQKNKKLFDMDFFPVDATKS